uniref:Uncharacterized protein n=1 Tax=Rhizophora mucronata TaxID=61149 RepID=A0A2P2QHE1_RHIMU
MPSMISLVLRELNFAFFPITCASAFYFILFGAIHLESKFFNR